METLGLADLDAVLVRAEQATSLLDRVLPVNLRAETARLLAAFRKGDRATPAFVYRPSELGPVTRVLTAVIAGLDGGGPWAKLYRERASELLLEARIAAAVGTAPVRDLAALRFRLEPGEAASADELAARWIREPGIDDRSGRTERGRVFSDDPHDARSLLAQIRRLASANGLALRVETRARMATFAATGASVIAVREGDLHTEDAARRIALHEVLGHGLPRHRATREPLGLFRTGTAQGSEDEEGRALLVEERSGLLDAVRRRELALRHTVASAVRAGADFTETVRLAVSHDVTADMAVSAAVRAHRGGGLAREIVYLPAFLRVRRAVATDPSLEGWLERGRVGVGAARALAGLRAPPAALRVRRAQANVASTGV